MNGRLGYGKSTAAIGLIALPLIAGFALAAWTLRRANPVRAAMREQTTTATSGFYCNLKALNMKERARHMQLTYEIERGRVETVEMANGFGFRFQDVIISLGERG